MTHYVHGGMVHFIVAILISCSLACAPRPEAQASKGSKEVDQVPVPISDPIAAAALAAAHSGDGKNLLALERIVSTYPGTQEAEQAASILQSLRGSSYQPLFRAIQALSLFDEETVDSSLKSYTGADLATSHAIRDEMKSSDYKKRRAEHLEAQKRTEQICKAAIAKIMGRKPSIMKSHTGKDNVVYISYRRPDDNSYWRNKCRLQESKVIWASDNPGDTGRWRTLPEDGTLTYTLAGSGATATVTIEET